MWPKSNDAMLSKKLLGGAVCPFISHVQLSDWSFATIGRYRYSTSLEVTSDVGSEGLLNVTSRDSMTREDTRPRIHARGFYIICSFAWAMGRNSTDKPFRDKLRNLLDRLHVLLNQCDGRRRKKKKKSLKKIDRYPALSKRLGVLRQYWIHRNRD